jgi:hypothetical protein
VAAKLKSTNIRIMARVASLKMSSCFMRLAKALGSLSFTYLCDLGKDDEDGRQPVLRT